jgi:hypothetical protein
MGADAGTGALRGQGGPWQHVNKGDGFLYRGRGVFQLTGRANYLDYGKLVGLSLVDHPELAEDPEISVLIACAYWKRHGLNQLATRTISLPSRTRSTAARTAWRAGANCSPVPKRFLQLLFAAPQRIVK